MAHKNKADAAAYNKRYRTEHKEEQREYFRKRYATHGDEHTPAAKRRQVESTLSRYHRLRHQAVDLYGGKCTCCGEMEYDFLQFDHVNDDGKHDRKKTGMGPAFIRHLLNNQPLDIQLLCANCHLVKTKGLICPHKRNS